MTYNTKIRYNHYHNGNDPVNPETELPHVRGTALYATCATLVDLSTGKALAEGWAYCSPRDVASRKKGREIAEGRLLKALAEKEKKDKEHRSKIDQFLSGVKNVLSHLI